MMTNMTDITDMTDAAMDVFLEVRGGANCVTVDHLSYDERVSVCKALGLTASTAWLMGAPYAAPRNPVGGADFEGAILDRQDLETE